MSSALITALGAGSNLDLQDILDKVKANEQQQLVALQSRQTKLATQISAYGAVQSALGTLQTAAQALIDPQLTNSAKVTVTGSDFTATAQPGATPMQSQVKVEALASTSQLLSGAISERAAAIGSGGTLAITLQDGSTASIDLQAGGSLDAIAKQINADGKIGVQASIINDGTGSRYLMLSSRQTGTQAAVRSVTVSGNSALQSAIGYDADQPASSALTLRHAATDAKVLINGVEITSGSNTLTKTIDQVTLTLTAVSKDDGGALTIEADTGASVQAVQAFVDAYNTVIGKIASVSGYDAGSNTSAPLTGDGLLRGIQNTLSQALRVLVPDGGLKTITDLGLDMTPLPAANGSGATVPAGGLLLNLDKLDSTHRNALSTALQQNAADAARVLKTLGTQIAAATKGMLGKTGSIGSRTASLNNLSATLQDSYTKTAAHIDANIASMRTNFIKLDVLISRMNSTSSYLTQQFAAWTNSKD
ncbi:MAG TPA: flagellar filament capping protein FliD [Bordetella sp.]